MTEKIKVTTDRQPGNGARPSKVVIEITDQNYMTSLATVLTSAAHELRRGEFFLTDKDSARACFELLGELRPKLKDAMRPTGLVQVGDFLGRNDILSHDRPMCWTRVTSVTKNSDDQIWVTTDAEPEEHTLLRYDDHVQASGK